MFFIFAENMIMEIEVKFDKRFLKRLQADKTCAPKDNIIFLCAKVKTKDGVKSIELVDSIFIVDPSERKSKKFIRDLFWSIISNPKL